VVPAKRSIECKLEANRVFLKNRNGKSDKRHKIGSIRPAERGSGEGCQLQIACRREQKALQMELR